MKQKEYRALMLQGAIEKRKRTKIDDQTAP